MQESSPMYITRNYRNSMTCLPGCFGATRLALGFNSYDRNRMRNQTQNQCKKRSYVVPVLIGDKPLIVGKKGRYTSYGHWEKWNQIIKEHGVRHLFILCTGIRRMH